MSSDRQGEAGASAGNVAWSTTEYCLQCAMRFPDRATYTLHTESVEHANMVLITGISDVKQDRVPCEFPPLFHCILCRVYKSNLGYYRLHLLDPIHEQMALHLRNISFFKDTILVGRTWKKDPETAEDYAELKFNLPNYCNVCDILCNGDITFESHIEGNPHKKYAESMKSCGICKISYVNHDVYESHLKSKLHKTFREFRDLLSISESEIATTPEREYKQHVSHYFCKLCNIKFNSLQLFRDHRYTLTHRRIRDLVRKMHMYKNESDQVAELCNEESVSVHYCELCRYWCEISVNKTFADHLQSNTHLKTDYDISSRFLPSWLT